MACQNKSITPLSLLPDGVMPVPKCGKSTFLYYREDGDLYFYDADIKTEFNLFHLTCRTSTETGTIPTNSLYFGITDQNIIDTNIKLLLTQYSYGNTSIAVTIFATPENPKVDKISILIPIGKVFNITQNGFTVRPSFTEIGNIALDDITYTLYNTANDKFIDMDSTFIITLT